MDYQYLRVIKFIAIKTYGEVISSISIDHAAYLNHPSNATRKGIRLRPTFSRRETLDTSRARCRLGKYAGGATIYWQ